MFRTLRLESVRQMSAVISRAGEVVSVSLSGRALCNFFLFDSLLLLPRLFTSPMARYTVIPREVREKEFC